MKTLVALICGIHLLLSIPFTDCYIESGRLLRFSSKCKADARDPWSYRGDNGPKFWGDTYPGCNGREQSPIALNSHTAVRDNSLSKLSMNNYDIPVSSATVENDGRTVLVTPSDGVERTIYVNGATYRLLQLHFHWGDAYHQGSEHTLDGRQYALELHFVHRNANNQIAVVGVFFQEKSQASPELQKLIDTFPNVMYNGSRTVMRSDLNLNNLLPSNPASYFRYPGSLTTPGCDEGVTWSVLTKPLPVGLHQMEEFRKLYSTQKRDASANCRLVNNYRPVQPLNRRTVLISQ